MPEGDSDIDMLSSPRGGGGGGGGPPNPNLSTSNHPANNPPQLLPVPPQPPRSRSHSRHRHFVPPPAPSPGGAARGRHSSDDESGYDDYDGLERVPILERPPVLLPRRPRRRRRRKRGGMGMGGDERRGGGGGGEEGDRDGDLDVGVDEQEREEEEPDQEWSEDEDVEGGVKLEVEIRGGSGDWDDYDEEEVDDDEDEQQEELNETFDFLELLCDVLRCPDDTLTTSYLYIHRYLRWFRHAYPPPTVPPFTLDLPTLSLASLSLSTKSTEAPRRLRDILLPSYRILHPTSPPLIYPSHHYDSLRSTLIQAELILLRALAFNIYLPLSYLYLPRILEKTLATMGDGGSSRRFGVVDDWREYSEDERQECLVVKVEETAIGKRSRWWVGRASRWLGGRGVFTGRTVAVAAVWLAMWEGGWGVGGVPGGGRRRVNWGDGKGKGRDQEERGEGKGRRGGLSREEREEDRELDRRRREAVRAWVDEVGGGRVDVDDFWEVVGILAKREGFVKGGRGRGAGRW